MTSGQVRAEAEGSASNLKFEDEFKLGSSRTELHQEPSVCHGDLMRRGQMELRTGELRSLAPIPGLAASHFTRTLVGPVPDK